jgi:hypothetical protein
MPTARQRVILEKLREGQALAEGKSKYAVATFDDGDEVEFRTAEDMQEEGWLYVLHDPKGKRTWALTREGLELLTAYD